MTSPLEIQQAADARRKRFEQAKSSLTSDQARNIGELGRQNPSLTPSVLYGAGKAGIRPGSPAADALNRADQEVQKDKGNWLQRGIRFGYKTIKTVGGAVLPDEVGQAARGVGGVVKGVTRGAEMGLSSIGQAAQGAGRAWYADGQFEVSDLVEGVKQTDLYQAHREVQREGGYAGLLTGDTDVDFGSGYFAGGDVTKQRRAAELGASGGKRIGGSTYTAGRWIANSVGLEPGNRAYSIVSGLADMSVMLGTDPSSYEKALTAPLRARTLFAGDASKGFDAAGTAARVDEGLATSILARGGATAPTADELAIQMGALPGIRNTVASDRVLEFLTADKRGMAIVEYAKKSTTFGDLYDATKGKLPPEMILALTKREMTGDEVIEILAGGVGATLGGLGRTARTDQKFGLDIEAKATVTGGLGTLATAKFVAKKRGVRAFDKMSGERTLPKDDLNETLRRADLFMKNATIGKADEIDYDGRKISRNTILQRFAEADGNEGMLDVALDMMRLGSAKAMTEFGIDKGKADELFKVFKSATTGARMYHAELVADETTGLAQWRTRSFGADASDLKADKTGMRPSPLLAAQFWDTSVPLPDPREIRANLSRYRNILSNPAVKMSTSALNVIQDNVFKPFVLLRPAYIARNQIDEQFRPAGAGLHSLFSHPIQYIHWTMSDQQGLGKLLGKVGFESRGATFGPDGKFFDELNYNIRSAKDALDDAKRAGDKAMISEATAAYEAAKKAPRSATPFTDGMSEFTRIQTGGLGNWRNRDAAQIKDDIVYQITDEGFAKAMAERLMLVHKDKIGVRIARGDDLDQIKADFWRGPLQKFRTDLSKQNDKMAHLNDEIGASQYIDEVAIFVNEAVGQSPELRAAAANGRIGRAALTDGDTPLISQRAIDEMNSLKTNAGYQGPPGVIGVRATNILGEDGNRYTRGVDWMFEQLANRPTQYLAKSPVFRQRYYQRAENLIGFMDPKAVDELIESARVANIKGKDIKRLESKRRPDGKMSFEEADLVAKADAADFVKELFYSLHERSQFFDITRLIFPFGEAFFDSAKKYSELVAKNPVLPYRLMQTIEGGRDLDTDGDGEGFFYTDEQTGEEMLAWPLSDQFNKLVGQEGAGKYRSPLSNLNILGVSVIPGFGSAVQISAAAMLPDDSDFNGIRALISPYGDRTLAGGALESFVPSWAQKVITGMNSDLSTPKQQRAFVQAKKDWMGYLVSTGEYDITDPAEQQRLLDDAASKAQGTFFIRGLAQAFLPSPPSPEFVAYDKDGTLQTQFRLAELYREIMDEQDELGTPESTNRIFIEMVGEQAMLAVVPNTKAAEGRSPIPPNKEALKFYQDNKDAAERFPTVFGMFAPDEEGAEFDWNAYNRSIETGERVVLQPEEAIRRANSNVARMIVDTALDVVRPRGADDKRPRKGSKEGEEQLRNLKAKLAEDFPGYSSSFSNSTPAMLEDLKRASVDPQLAKTPAGQGLAIWLQARDLAEQTAQERFGVSWKQAQSSREIRENMRVLAERLSEDFKGFSNIYERALEREMAKD